MDERNYHIRQATEDDAEGILKLFQLVAASCDTILTSEGEVNYTIEEERAIIRKWHESNNSIFLVAEAADGQIIGMLSFRGGQRCKEQHCGTLGMSTHPEWQGIGVGKGLMRALVDWATAHPVIERVQLAVMTHNAPALRLYRSFGFEEEGRRRRSIKFADGSYGDTLEMCLFC